MGLGVREEDRSWGNYVGKYLRWSRLSRMVVCRASRTSRKRKDSGQRIPPPTPSLHPAIPKLPTRWRAGAGTPALPPILRPSLPSGMGLHLGLHKLGVLEFSCPHNPGLWPQPLGSRSRDISSDTPASGGPCATVSPHTAVCPCSRLPQLLQPGFHRYVFSLEASLSKAPLLPPPSSPPRPHAGGGGPHSSHFCPRPQRQAQLQSQDVRCLTSRLLWTLGDQSWAEPGRRRA